MVPRQVPDLVDAARRPIPVAMVRVCRHAATRGGNAPTRGLPRMRRAIHDANRRGTSRTAQHASLLFHPVITIRRRRIIARTVMAATRSALIIDAFAIHE